MTTTYELRIRDRNLDLPIIGGNGRHTGFELIIKDGDNIRIQVVELLQGPANNKIIFNIKEYNGKYYTLADGQQVVWAVQTFKKVYIWGVLNRFWQKNKDTGE